jgi:hypothetical protein
MNKIGKTQTAYNFRNTCHKCFNDIEFPLLGDFAYGEIIFQTKDGKGFYIAVLIDNKTFDFIADILENNKDFKSSKADPQKILALIADKVDNKEFTTDYPICPICKSRQSSFGDNIRTNKIELGFATWTDFESLSQESKLIRLQEVINL